MCNATSTFLNDTFRYALTPKGAHSPDSYITINSEWNKNYSMEHEIVNGNIYEMRILLELMIHTLRIHTHSHEYPPFNLSCNI